MGRMGAANLTTLESRLNALRAAYLDNINNAELLNLPDLSTLSAAYIGYLANINNANLATIPAITAARIAKLDFLDAALSTLRATEFGRIDVAVSTAKADLTTLESRLSAARATKLDNLDVLLSTFRATEFGRIDATVSSRLASAAYQTEKGTNNALLAANYLGHQFTEYTYSSSLGANAYFSPPERTIVMVSFLDATPQKLDLYYYSAVIKHGADSMGATETGYTGCVYHTGPGEWTVRYKNTNASSRTLKLYGVSMA